MACFENGGDENNTDIYINSKSGMPSLNNDSLFTSSSLNEYQPVEFDNTPRCEEENNTSLNDLDPCTFLNNIRISNANRLIIGQLNINSIRNKIDALKTIISGKMDILVVTETKLDDTFPINQFLIDGFSTPFRLNRDSRGGGVMIYIREDIPCRKLETHKTPDNFEGIVFEINLRKVKWLLFGGYNPHKENTAIFFSQLTPILDHYLNMTIIFELVILILKLSKKL